MSTSRPPRGSAWRGMLPPCSKLASPTETRPWWSRLEGVRRRLELADRCARRPVRLAVADAVVAQVLRGAERRVVVVPEEVPPGRPRRRCRAGVMPMCFWKAMTALRVGVSRRSPLTVETGVRLSSSSRWTASTAWPVLPGLSGTISLSPGALADDAVGGQAVGGLERLDRRPWSSAPKIAIERDRARRGPEQGLDGPDVRAAVAEALVREGVGRRGRGGRHVRHEEHGGEGDRQEAAEGGRHDGSLPNQAGAAGQPASARLGGSAPARWQVAAATAIARLTVSHTAGTSARSARPWPRSIQRARKRASERVARADRVDDVDRRDGDLEGLRGRSRR